MTLPASRGSPAVPRAFFLDAQSRPDKLKLSINIMAFNPHVHCKHLFITPSISISFKQDTTFSARTKLNIFSDLDRK